MAEMTEERRKKIEEFYNTMGAKRQQVSDGSLLDQCQQMMGELLGKREAPPEPEPEKKEGEEKKPQEGEQKQGESGQEQSQ